MTTQTQTVAEFVLARIAEDEAEVCSWDSDGRARVATVWTGGKPGYTTVASDSRDGRWIADGHEVVDARHARVLFDPARVLADCAAKRRIVELHAEQTAERRVAQSRTDIDDLVLGHIEGQEMGLAWAVTALASAYADHPDYRDEWRA